MSKFVKVGNELVNTDKIIRVIKGNSSLSIILEDDERIDVDRRMIRSLEYICDEIVSNDRIISIIQAPEELYAVYDMEDDKGNRELEAIEIKLLGLLQDGRVEPVELCDGYYELCSECSNFKGTYTKKQIEDGFIKAKII